MIKNKLALIFLTLSLILTTTGAGCNIFNRNTTSNNNPEVTLTVWRLFDDQEIIDPIIKSYIESKKSKYNLHINYVKKDYNEYIQDTTNALAAGQGPDIWMIRNDWVAKHYDKLIPAPTSLITVDKYKEKYPDIAVNNNIIDEKIYGLPLSIDTLVLYINSDIFQSKISELNKQNNYDDAQILTNKPSNWEELIKTSQLLTIKNKDNIERAGIALGTTSNVARSTDIITALMLQNQTKMIQDDKLSATFNQPIIKSTGEQFYSAKSALEFYKSFSDPSSTNYSWNASMPDSLQAFMEGKTAMMINFGYVRSDLKQQVPNLNYDTIPLPQIKDALEAIDYASYWTETVTNNSKNPELAWDFVQFMNGNFASSYQQATDRPPAQLSSSTIIPIVKNRMMNKSSVFTFQLASAQDWHKGYYPEKVDDVFVQLLQNTMEGNQDIQRSLDKASADVTELLRKKPY